MSETPSSNRAVDRVLQNSGLGGLNSEVAARFTQLGWGGDAAVLNLDQQTSLTVENRKGENVRAVLRRGPSGNQFSVIYIRKGNEWLPESSTLERSRGALAEVGEAIEQNITRVAVSHNLPAAEVDIRTIVGHTPASVSGEVAYYTLQFIRASDLSVLGKATTTQITNLETVEALERLGIAPVINTSGIPGIGSPMGGLSGLFPGSGLQSIPAFSVFPTQPTSEFSRPNQKQPGTNQIAEILLRDPKVTAAIFKSHLARAESLRLSQPFDPQKYIEKYGNPSSS